MYWGRLKSDSIIPADKSSAAEHAALLEKHGNAILKVTLSLPRSRKHHGLFFAAIAKAYDNWPETHEFQPENADHLRQWLECKAGYRDSVVAEKADGREGCALALAERLGPAVTSAFARGKWPFIIEHTGHVCVITAKSIAYDAISQTDFNTVSERVSDVLKAETGMSLDDFKEQAA